MLRKEPYMEEVITSILTNADMRGTEAIETLLAQQARVLTPWAD